MPFALCLQRRGGDQEVVESIPSGNCAACLAESEWKRRGWIHETALVNEGAILARGNLRI